MPVYEYVCSNEHVTERRAGYNNVWILCPVCKKHAHRRAAYREQCVIFPDPSFTRTIIPPAPPKPPKHIGSRKKRPSTSQWYEQMDEYAEKQYKDDVNVKPERDKVIAKALRDAERGKVF